MWQAYVCRKLGSIQCNTTYNIHSVHIIWDALSAREYAFLTMDYDIKNFPQFLLCC